MEDALLWSFSVTVSSFTVVLMTSDTPLVPRMQVKRGDACTLHTPGTWQGYVRVDNNVLN